MTLTLLVARPERVLLALMAAQIVFWTLAPALSHSAPPLDVVEMYVWGREWVVATSKHPNLPGLVLEPLRLLAGQAGWAAYLVSQIFVAITFWAVFALGRDLMDGPRALAGTLLLTGIYFFNWRTPELNHNVAQMPLWALVMLTLSRATSANRSIDWLLLGAFAGLSLWAKYSSAVLLVVAAAWILSDAESRRRIRSPGPWLALGVFALVAAPQALWLVDHDFSPFAYAARRARNGDWFSPIQFLSTLALHHLPMLILLACAGWFGKAVDAPPRPERRALHYLLWLGLGPVVLTVLAAASSGADLRSSWAAPMTVLSGLIAIALTSDRFSATRLRRLAMGAFVLVVGASGLYYGYMRFGVALTGKPLRGNWPQAEISRQLESHWIKATNTPLRIVAGDIWTAGLIGLDSRNPPSVLIDGNYQRAPWVTPEEVARYGALIVGSGRRIRLPALGDDLDQRELQVKSTYGGGESQTIRVRYAILPPREISGDGLPPATSNPSSAQLRAPSRRGRPAGLRFNH